MLYEFYTFSGLQFSAHMIFISNTYVLRVLRFISTERQKENASHTNDNGASRLWAFAKLTKTPHPYHTNDDHKAFSTLFTCFVSVAYNLVQGCAKTVATKKYVSKKNSIALVHDFQKNFLTVYDHFNKFLDFYSKQDAAKEKYIFWTRMSSNTDKRVR